MVEGDHDAVALLEVAHGLADFLDDADAFVAEHGAGLHAGDRAAHEVQIGAADGGRGDADDGVRGLLDARLGHIAQTDVADAVEHDGFHGHLRPGHRRPALWRHAALAGRATERATRRDRATACRAGAR